MIARLMGFRANRLVRKPPNRPVNAMGPRNSVISVAVQTASVPWQHLVRWLPLDSRRRIPLLQRHAPGPYPSSPKTESDSSVLRSSGSKETCCDASLLTFCAKRASRLLFLVWRTESVCRYCAASQLFNVRHE
eukprot:1207952-Rhodomonas_salina.1